MKVKAERDVLEADLRKHRNSSKNSLSMEDANRQEEQLRQQLTFYKQQVQSLKQALERRRAAAQGSGQGQREQTDEDWWRGAKRNERAGWLSAYYAEFGGQLVITYAAVSPCVSCYGAGTTPEVGPDGKLIRQPCFLCHNTKWMRSFKAY